MKFPFTPDGSRGRLNWGLGFRRSGTTLYQPVGVSRRFETSQCLCLQKSKGVRRMFRPWRQRQQDHSKRPKPPTLGQSVNLRRPEFSSAPLRRFKSLRAEVIAATSNKTSPLVRRIYWHITCHWKTLPYFIYVTTRDSSCHSKATDGYFDGIHQTVFKLTHNNSNFLQTQKFYYI